METRSNGHIGQGAARDVEATLAVLRRQVATICEEGTTLPVVVRVCAGDISLEVEWGRPAVSEPVPAAAPSAPAPEVPSTMPGRQVCAQTVGVFYRAKEPGAQPFAKVGDVVVPGQQVGIIEAMKLMTPVHADIGGRVVEFLAEDGVAVEHGQPLLLLELAA